MENTVDFVEARKKKMGCITPKALLENLKEDIERGEEIDAIVYVVKTKEGVIKTGWSDIKNTEAIGFLEIGKRELVDNMFTID